MAQFIESANQRSSRCSIGAQLINSTGLDAALVKRFRLALTAVRAKCLRATKHVPITELYVPMVNTTFNVNRSKQWEERGGQLPPGAADEGAQNSLIKNNLTTIKVSLIYELR